MPEQTQFYDSLGVAYDLMISWEERLEREGEFFRRLFEEHGVRSVLDCACGSGRHAIEFRKWGLDVVGADASAEMIVLARRNAEEAKVGLEFLQIDMREMGQKLHRKFDAVVCLGNTLPHLLNEHDLSRAMSSLYTVLNKKGILVIQNRNYDRIWQKKIRFMNPTSAMRDDTEYLFFRMNDFQKDHLVFHIIVFSRKKGQKWNYHVHSTQLRPWLKRELDDALKRAGFARLSYYGDYQAQPYSIDTDDLIIVAEKEETSSSGKKGEQSQRGWNSSSSKTSAVKAVAAGGR